MIPAQMPAFADVLCSPDTVRAIINNANTNIAAYTPGTQTQRSVRVMISFMSIRIIEMPLRNGALL